MKEEIQLTAGSYGHTLNPAQAFTADGQWVVYDTRNDGTQIGRTCCIEKVNVVSGVIVKLYSSAGQTEHGPGVGAVACHPHSNNKVIFIHGLENCTAQRPYGFTRRFGAIHHDGQSGIVHAEARVVDAPLVAGALRGGTHAHTWSGDGEWISFTYNDYLMENLARSTAGKVKDLRTIGVMAPQKKVVVQREDAGNFSGEYFSVVAATVVETPLPGSDEIEKAFDECWVGNDGYKRSDGSWQKRAIAFQGHVRDAHGNLLTEVFVADIPDDITQAIPGKPLEGTLISRPNVPAHLHQRRVTHTGTHRHPGLQGPRSWLRTSPDGACIYFLMKDDHGVVQVYEVPVAGGDIRQVTHLTESVQTQFNLNADGTKLAFGAGNAVWVVEIDSAAATILTQKYTDDEAPITTVLWNPQGDMLVYNRYVSTGSERYLQIFKIEL